LLKGNQKVKERFSDLLKYLDFLVTNLY